MSGPNHQRTRQLVSLCLTPAVSERPASREFWEELLSLALHHGVAPLLWSRLKDQELPRQVRSRLAGIYAANLVLNRALKAEQEKVLAAFTGQAIPGWPLKGAHLSESLYGDLGIRQAADIDVLIRQHNLEKADALLADLDFVRIVPDELARFRRNRALVYRKSNSQGLEFALDLHQRLSSYRRRDPRVSRSGRAG